jgi:hypothetical protein
MAATSSGMRESRTSPGKKISGLIRRAVMTGRFSPSME